MLCHGFFAVRNMHIACLVIPTTGYEANHRVAQPGVLLRTLTWRFRKLNWQILNISHWKQNLETVKKSYVNLCTFTILQKTFFTGSVAQRNGFFVECGGFDGESYSNSLVLERDRGWGGILVEPDTHNYQQMKTKNRKAYTAHSCLTETPYPSKVREFMCK